MSTTAYLSSRTERRRSYGSGISLTIGVSAAYGEARRITHDTEHERGVLPYHPIPFVAIQAMLPGTELRLAYIDALASVLPILDELEADALTKAQTYRVCPSRKAEHAFYCSCDEPCGC